MWYGEAGIMDLYTEQRCGQVMMLLPIICLIESFWVSSGLSHHTLISTEPLAYLQAPWVESVKQFLHQLNAKIEIPQLGDLPPLRINDSPIMQQSFTSSFPISSLQMINACRMYLQVHSVAEITHHSGNTLLECALFGTCDDNDQPILWQTSISTIW
jgi:hypothetical protein